MYNSFYLNIKSIKLIVLLLLSCMAYDVAAQDIGVLSSSSPNSGCQLSVSETVTVVVFNYGANYSGSFDVSYEINGGVPVTQSVTLPLFASTNSYSYTFPVNVDLSIANTYNFKFYTNLTGDINNGNDTLNNVIVESDTLSSGGSVSSSQSVCLGNNNGALNLNSFIGDIQYWESSTTNGSIWNNIPNITNVESYTNISQETWYRSVVVNGFCPSDTSSIAVLSIDSLTISGTIAGATTLCSPPNGGVLTLSGERGAVLDWEYSSNGGSVWNSLGSTSNTYNYINQPSTYLYRAMVQNGSCSIAYSDTAEVEVLVGAVGGLLTPSSQVECLGFNSDTINLSGYSGSISGWEMSNNLGVLWTPIANTDTFLTYLNLTQETWYRALLSGCNQDTSSMAIIQFDPLPVGGTLTADATVCENLNAGTLNLSGQIGTIVAWQNSIDGGISWISIGNISDSINYNNLITTTLYRVLVSSGACGQLYSDTATITVVSEPDAGIITGPTNVCASLNSDSLIAAAVIGSILDWEISTNAGVTWASLGNSNGTNSFSNITQTSLYQVIATNGTCPNDTSQYLVTVDDPTISGTLFSDNMVCYNSSGFIYVDGQQGSVLGWELSVDNGINWNSLGVFVDTVLYTDILNQTKYKTFIKNGSCPIDTSNIVVIDLFPYNIGTSNDTLIEEGNSATISAFGGLFYTWSPSVSLSTSTNSTTVATPLFTTNYLVSIVDGNGCVYSDTVTIDVVMPEMIELDFIISDLITANGDGYNDTWNILGIEKYPDTKVFVFNTSGNIVFESSNYDNSWKGTYNGNQLPDGTYYYVVEIDAEANVEKGFVTIVSE
jgi:gliding motility-associated-like protein